MDRFREEEVGSNETYTSKSGLQVEDHTPGLECDDDTSNKGAESWANQGTAQKPSHRGTSFRWAVDISNASCTDSKKAL